MKRILLRFSRRRQVKILAEKFSVPKSFVVEALNLEKASELKLVSHAKNIREAEEEYIQAEGCCYDDERAALRKWIEFADNEKEILKIYYRISCHNSLIEKKMAIRKMALILESS